MNLLIRLNYFAYSIFGYVVLFFSSFSLSLAMPGDGADNNLVLPAYCHSNQPYPLINNSGKTLGSYPCASVTLMYLMQHHGRLTTDDTNEKTALRIAMEMGLTINAATQKQLATWLKNHNFHVTTGDHLRLDALLNYLNNKTPVIILLQNHWVIAEYYDAATHQIMIRDACCQITTLSENEFATLQHDKSQPQSEYQYIVAMPV